MPVWAVAVFVVSHIGFWFWGFRLGRQWDAEG